MSKESETQMWQRLIAVENGVQAIEKDLVHRVTFKQLSSNQTRNESLNAQHKQNIIKLQNRLEGIEDYIKSKPKLTWYERIFPPK